MPGVLAGDCRAVVARYISAADDALGETIWSEETAPGIDEVKLLAVRTYSQDGNHSGLYASREDLCVELEFMAYSKPPVMYLGFDLLTQEGMTVLRTYQADTSPAEWPELQIGRNRWYCTIPAGLLNGGIYSICPRIKTPYKRAVVGLDRAVQIQVVLDHGVSPIWNAIKGGRRDGVIAPIFKWRAVTQAEGVRPR